jgi:hypothetical protein
MLFWQALLSPRAHQSLHFPPLSHCEEFRFGGATKQSQTDNEIAAPLGLAMTVLEEWSVNYFMLPFITLPIFSQQKDP